MAASAGIELLGQIPIEPAVSAGSDGGTPAALGTGPAATAFADLANRLVTDVVPPADMAGCSARMLAAMDAAIAAADG